MQSVKSAGKAMLEILHLFALKGHNIFSLVEVCDLLLVTCGQTNVLQCF